MTPKEFHEFLSQPLFTSREKSKAWDIYNKTGPEEALEFVKNIEDKFFRVKSHLQLRPEPVPYKIWGKECIDEGALLQMAGSASLPVALMGALMPDAHSGYGLPIGGVLATDNCVIPYAVGVDIACRMMMTVYPASPDALKLPGSGEYKLLQSALIKNTHFGSGPAGLHKLNIEHPVLDRSKWRLSKLTLSLQQTAIQQIGTSGGGNHFVEWGSLEITDSHNQFQLPKGHYLALLSHSGSRGVGFKIASHYTQLAMSQMEDLDKSVKHLAWLSLDQDAGREYWEAMNLAGEFASACHHVIHERVAKAAGLTPIALVENHHNFAWKEKILVKGIERDAIVHRKGATPAGNGVLGIIPGTMADAGYLVAGKGNPESLNSASHGSGRLMARTKAKKTITPKQHRDYLLKQGVELIGGGLDEAPQAYKPIEVVMESQKDLVDILGKFQPKIVRMASEDGFGEADP